MNYPEELRERYNECMYDERDIIQRFLEKQYDIRYGRQRDTWHFEPAVKMMMTDGEHVSLTDIKLDKNVFVMFSVIDSESKRKEYECGYFAYGELGNIIEALPDAGEIEIKNAIDDISEMCKYRPFNFYDNPFKAFIKGLGLSIRSVNVVDGHVKAYTEGGKNVMDEENTGLILGLRNFMRKLILHSSQEYKIIMDFLALQDNLSASVDDYDKTNYGTIVFMIEGTDLEFDVSSFHRGDSGNLVIYGADINCEDELITLDEKDIRPEYLKPIVEWIKKKNARPDIIDTYNGHNAELVRKINAAWRDDKYHDKFSEILLALLYRDHEEYIDKYCEIEDYSVDYAMEHAHEIMEGVCDDLDLECILNFIRYEED